VKHVQTINVNDYELNRVQDNLVEVVNTIADKPIVDGVLIKRVILAAGSDNLVIHGLSRTPSLVLVGTPNTNAVVWQTGVVTDSYVVIRTSADCTVNMWVC